MRFSYIKRTLAIFLSGAIMATGVPVMAEEEEIITLAEEPDVEAPAESPVVEETPEVQETPAVQEAPAEAPADTSPNASAESVPETEAGTASDSNEQSTESQKAETKEKDTEKAKEKDTETDEAEAESEEVSDASEQEDEELATEGSGDPNADVESAAVWESTLPALTGIWRDDIIAVAQSQLGYTESTRNYQGSKGYTRYGAWYGIPYGDWCAMFASFCLYYAGVPTDTVPEDSYTVTWIQNLSAKGLYQSKGNGYMPQKGDLIFFARDGVNVTHVGLVEEAVTDEYGNLVQINTIEGNSSNMVKRNSYNPGDGYIIGYGMIPEQPAETLPTSLESEEVTITDASSADDMLSALMQIKQQYNASLLETESEISDDETEETTIPSAEVLRDNVADIRSMMN